MKEHSQKQTFAFIILAGGSSSRFGSKKELAQLPQGQTPLKLILDKITQCPWISHLHVVYHPSFQNEILTALQTYTQPVTHSPCGETRQKSVLEALRSLQAIKPDFVLIHDGARPWFSQELLTCLCRELPEKKAIIPTISATESIKTINSEGQIVTHLHRCNLAVAQTPQAFCFARIAQAHEYAAKQVHVCTDDAEVWAMCHTDPVYIIPGEIDNKKITFRSDIL